MTIEVHLNPDANPAVTTQPPRKDKDKGKDTITWQPGKKQDFDFVSLHFDTQPNPFGPPDVKKNKITVEDDNTGDGSVGDFFYTIVVSANGKQYSTNKVGPGGEQGDPFIRNRPG